MRRSAFVKLNQDRWKQFDEIVSSENPDADELADLFIQVSDDLAFSSTQYPESETTAYLNTLASRIHLKIYRNRRESRSRLITFWTKELPSLFHQYRKEMLISFSIFMVSVLIGVVSAAYDEGFARLILGDEYINMTLQNIEEGKPMGVYGSIGSFSMFWMITVNNVFVSFLTFLWGGFLGGFPMFIFLSFGTAYILLRNGIMLGVFQFFFFQKGLGTVSMLSIWLHGTIEISSIIIAGAAGIVAGNSILFPGTYSRLDSFKKGFKDGLKMIIGLIPLFIVAGLIESYITRLYAWHWLQKLSLISLSILFVIWYFIIYPKKINQNDGKQLYQP